jgi:sulfur transfer protein SufE
MAAIKNDKAKRCKTWRLTKGIIAILIRTFSNKTASAILEADMDFIDAIGLKEHLSPHAPTD